MRRRFRIPLVLASIPPAPAACSRARRTAGCAFVAVLKIKPVPVVSPVQARRDRGHGERFLGVQHGGRFRYGAGPVAKVACGVVRAFPTSPQGCDTSVCLLSLLLSCYKVKQLCPLAACHVLRCWRGRSCPLVNPLGGRINAYSVRVTSPLEGPQAACRTGLGACGFHLVTDVFAWCFQSPLLFCSDVVHLCVEGASVPVDSLWPAEALLLNLWELQQHAVSELRR